jgi:hypothetical protein
MVRCDLHIKRQSRLGPESFHRLDLAFVVDFREFWFEVLTWPILILVRPCYRSPLDSYSGSEEVSKSL